MKKAMIGVVVENMNKKGKKLRIHSNVTPENRTVNHQGFNFPFYIKPI